MGRRTKRSRPPSRPPFAKKVRSGKVKGRWKGPDGKFISERKAVARNVRVRRALMIKNLALATGKTQRQVRKKVKGLPTESIVGRFGGTFGTKKRPRIVRLTPSALKRRAKKLQKVKGKSKRRRRSDQKKARSLEKLARLRKRADDVLDELDFIGSETILSEYSFTRAGREFTFIQRPRRRSRVRRLKVKRKAKTRKTRKKKR